MKDFRGLKVWEKAHALALTVYQASAAFPRRRCFGLTAQVRRAAPRSRPTWPKDVGGKRIASWARYRQIAHGFGQRAGVPPVCCPGTSAT